MVTPAARRQAAGFLQADFEVSERRACSVVELPRATCRYQSERVEDPQLRKDPRVNVVDVSTVNYQYVMRFNHLVPPFNNVKVREAAMWAMNQESFLRAQVGPENEGLFSTCPSVYPCGTPLPLANIVNCTASSPGAGSE